jgi:uncharacterized protein with HEPN domain
MIGPTLRLQDYLQHIIEAIERIGTYTDDLDHAAFLLDAKTQDAVIRNLQIVGEAARMFGGVTRTSSLPCETGRQKKIGTADARR